MERSFGKDLYSEGSQLSKLELDPTSTSNTSTSNRFDEDELLDGDNGSLWGGSDEEFEKASDLDREWQRRRDQFHTIGYRDGLLAGKETSAQEGFNMGFKESFHAGYNWGLVRGVTSALACLPNELKERLVERQEKRSKFQSLYESLHSLSTTDALKLYYDEVVAKKAVELSEHAEASLNETGLQDQSSDCSRLENHYAELQSLILESPAIQVHSEVQK